jgi:hypothetical protein
MLCGFDRGDKPPQTCHSGTKPFPRLAEHPPDRPHLGPSVGISLRFHSTKDVLINCREVLADFFRPKAEKIDHPHATWLVRDVPSIAIWTQVFLKAGNRAKPQPFDLALRHNESRAC